MDSNKLSAILVDDEKHSLSNLSFLIKGNCRLIEVIDTANDSLLAIQKINHLKPEVVFLDINMPNHSGFQIIEQLSYIPLVVFVTAHEKYALQAFKSCALDFLLKPIDIRELVETEKKIYQLFQIKTQLNLSYKESLNSLGLLINQQFPIKKLTLPGINGHEIIDIDSIIYIHGENNYSFFHLDPPKNLVVAKTLKEYEELLSPNGFIRIHKSYIINLSYLKTIKKLDVPEVILRNGDCLPISRRRMPELLEWVKKNNNRSQ